MNADELKKELREQARKWWFETPEIALDFMIDELLVPIAEPREKRIAELEAQIEKMKNCGNCKNEGNYKEPYRYGTGWCNICKRHKVAKGNFDKWEIKENGRN